VHTIYDMAETLHTEASKLGVQLTPSELDTFDLYAKELIAWNDKINLTTITDPADIMTKHFIDSLSLISTLTDKHKTLLDIGSGAGFPGIPIKIARPDLTVTLVESVGKKVAFLEHAIKILKLKNIEAVLARAEELGHEENYREKYDVVTARAVANLASLSEYALPFLKIGGMFIAQKVATDEEVKKSERAIEILGGKLKEILPIRLKNLEERHLVIIEKVSPTPKEYPRRVGMPLKKPL
jgi:16S rRNA (guanine527-N7)-methyltransferase